MKTIKFTNSLRFSLVIMLLLQFPQIFAINKNYCSEYIRVWGLVKYYTPFCKNNPPNIDSAFQQDIKDLLVNNNKNTFNNAINNILKFSQRNICSSIIYETNPLRLSQIDSLFGWIKTSHSISFRNKDKLVRLTHLTRDRGNAFVKNDDSTSAVFINERKFISAFPGVEIRLLALSRYWNAINYFFPHKSLMAADWGCLLDTTIDELIECKNEYEFHLAIVHLASQIEDGHGAVQSYTLEKHYGYYQLPFEVSFINNQLFITRILKSAINNPFNFGDIILEINGQTFDDYYSKDSCFIWGSNTKRKKNISASNFLRSQEAKDNIIRLKRNDTLLEVNYQSIKSYPMKDSDFVNYNFKKGYLLGKKFLYVDLSVIDSTNFGKIVLSSEKSTIIIDLRKYPNSVFDQIADLFAPKDLPFAAYRYPDISLPGNFSPPILTFLKPKKNSIKANYEQIILMVNYTTLSQGEFMCMAFQCLPHVITIGDKTAGADGNICRLILPGNISTSFTGVVILYPDGQQTQQTGVKIDLRFDEQGTGISSGKDEELDFLINTIIKEGS